ncbi:cytochrome oxidase putative small subunit CydP [Thauera phenylacetica]
MNPTDRRLVREITLVIVLKLILITALWWAFIRDAKVAVDPGAMAAQVVAPTSTKQHSTSGESHGQ